MFCPDQVTVEFAIVTYVRVALIYSLVVVPRCLLSDVGWRGRGMKHGRNVPHGSIATFLIFAPHSRD